MINCIVNDSKVIIFGIFFLKKGHFYKNTLESIKIGSKKFSNPLIFAIHKKIKRVSGRNKLIKFSELSTFQNVYQNYNLQAPSLTDCKGDTVDLKGNWAKEHFKNDQPIVLELACGKGEYTLGLAALNPHINYIGVDIKGSRIWRGAKTAIESGLNNVAFCRTRIEQLSLFFGENELDEIWITFADPFLSKPKRRLTAARFLKMYRLLLKPDGVVNLKIDDETLYEFSLEMIAEENCTIIYNNDDIYTSELYRPELEIKTYYETQHLAKKKKIKFVQFKLS